MTAGAGFLAIWSDVESRGDELSPLAHAGARGRARDRAGLPRCTRVPRSAGGGIAATSFFTDLNRPASSVAKPISHASTRRPNGHVASCQSFRILFVAEGVWWRKRSTARVAWSSRSFASNTKSLGPAGSSAISRHWTESWRRGSSRFNAAAPRSRPTRNRCGPNDQSFPALLLVEALSDAALDAALHELQIAVRIAAPLARYDQIFALIGTGSSMLACDMLDHARCRRSPVQLLTLE